jgi:hypothetical protein
MCERLVGLPDVTVLAVDDQPAHPIRVHVEQRVARPGCPSCATPAWSKGRQSVVLTCALAAVGTIGVLLVVLNVVTFFRAVVDLGALMGSTHDESRRDSSISFATWFMIDSGLLTVTGAALIWFVVRARRQKPSLQSGSTVITILLIAVAGLWLVGYPRRIPATAAGLALAALIVLILRKTSSTNRVGMTGLSR